MFVVMTLMLQKINQYYAIKRKIHYNLLILVNSVVVALA
jgi:hypothetical protein